VHPDVSKAGEVLSGCVEDPLLVTKPGGELTKVRKFDGVNEVVRGSPSVNLDQIGTRGVTKATGPLDIQRQWALSRLEGI